MFEITTGIEWDMGHRVPNHNSKCRNLHGHRYRLELTLSGELNNTTGASSEGMIVDFGDVKKILSEEIYDKLDHGFMFFENDAVLTEFFNKADNESFKSIAVPFVPTVENIARWCHEQLANQFRDTIKITNIRLFETPQSWTDFKPEPS